MAFQSGRGADGIFIETPMAHRRAFTPRELGLLDEIKSITPRGFIGGIPNTFDADIRMLGTASQAISDYNGTQPQSNWNAKTLPPMLFPLIAFGTQIYYAVLTQMRLSLIDISYNDSGLSISFNRVNNLGNSINAMKPIWERRIQSVKMAQLVDAGGVGLRTPRYQGALSRVIGQLGEGAMMWGSV